MIDAEYTTPEVPTAEGDDNAVFFTKRGREYRIVLAEPDVWVIHGAGTPPATFQIVLENPDRTRRIFDAHGVAYGVHFTALGESLGKVIGWHCP